MVWALLVALLGGEPPADSHAALVRAEALYGEAQYADAVAALDELLARTDLGVRDRRNATFYLGMGHLALGHEEAARARFREVLEQDSDYALPRYSSPKIRALFERVRAEVANAPRLTPLPPLLSPVPVGAEHARLRFRAERLGGHTAYLYWRLRGSGEYARTPMGGGRELGAEPLLPQSTAADEAAEEIELEYFGRIEEDGRTLAHAGSPEQPLEARIPVHRASQVASGPATGERASTPIYHRWWFFCAAGVVLAGGVTAAVLASRSGPGTGALDIRFQVGP